MINTTNEEEEIIQSLLSASDYAFTNPQKGIELVAQALEYFVSRADKQKIADCYKTYGLLYHTMGLHLLAYENFNHAFLLYEEIGDRRKQAGVLNNMGISFKFGNRHKDALEVFNKALLLFLEEGDIATAASVYSNLGMIYTRLDDYDKSLENYEKAAKINTETNNEAWLAKNYVGLAENAWYRKNTAKAIEYYSESLRLVQKHNDLHAVCSVLNSLAFVYRENSNYAEAESCYNESIRIAEQNGFKHQLVLSLFDLADLKAEHGEFTQSYSHLKKAYQLKTEIFEQNQTQQLNTLTTTFDLTRKQKEAELIREKNTALEEKNRLIETEKKRSDELLLNILPEEVAEELKQKGYADARHFDNVTVFFSDFKSFTTISEKLTPQVLVNELHECFSAFDKIMDKYGIEKIKTVGDAYLAVSGLPVANPNHAEDVVKAAQDVLQFMENRKKQNGDRHGLYDIRIGINSGNVVAGIVGVKKFAYDIWGDTVNTAARMEQNGEAGKVNISETTYELVKNKFSCEYRGEIDAKNKGKLKMYFVS
ncbi:MAG: tetratricopeptide repeat protein [Chitinophagales bacterium]|nr:tetratricopeptide repeat protein [Chitinophagales bacterium]